MNNNKKGYSKQEAKELLNKITINMQPPYKIVGFGLLTDKLEDYKEWLYSKNNLNSFDTIYKEFRANIKIGRYCIMIESQVGDKNLSLVDTNILEKATI